AGLGILILGYVVVLKDKPGTRKILVGVAVFGIAMVSLLYFFRQTSFVSKIPALGRAVNTTYTVLKGTARWITWEVAIKSWGQRPVFGWGPNNFFYAFNSNYDPRSLNFGYGETWFDNAHNIILNTLAVQGAVGIIFYLGLFVVAIWIIIAGYRKRSTNIHVVVVGLAFLVAHLIQNVTVFENPTSYLYFMFWLAMMSRLSNSDDGVVKNIQPPSSNTKLQFAPDKRVSFGLISTVGIIFFLFIFIFEIQPARANMKTLNALKILSYQPQYGAQAVRDALAFNSPHIDDIRGDLGRTVAQTLSRFDSQNADKQKGVELFNIAQEALVLNTRLHPLDIRNYLTLAQLNQSGYMLTGNSKYIMDYGNNLEDALKYSPRRQQILYNLANFKLQIGQSDEAIKILEGTINDNPKISESYWRLAYAYHLAGKKDKVKEVIALAGKNGIVFNESELGIINQFLAASSTAKK
ncbi:MAG: O-antigen ligase family protein, partial [Patescibacteria group bacterium]